MSAVHVIRWIMAACLFGIAVFCLLKPQRLPYAYASALTVFGLAVAQLLGMAKDTMAVLDGVALIVMGVACGLILSESIRRWVAEGRSRRSGSAETAAR